MMSGTRKKKVNVGLLLSVYTYLRRCCPIDTDLFAGINAANLNANFVVFGYSVRSGGVPVRSPTAAVVIGIIGRD